MSMILTNNVGIFGELRLRSTAQIICELSVTYQ